MVSTRIKQPKELKGLQEVTVEMFENSTELDPVRAVERALKYAKKGKPLAMRASGAIMTKGWVNRILKKALAGVVDYELNTVSSHSFRSGLATAMARQGYSDEEIQRQGRWASSAFLTYLKMGRSTRLKQQLELSEAMSRIAAREIEECGNMRRAMQMRG